MSIPQDIATVELQYFVSARYATLLRGIPHEAEATAAMDHSLVRPPPSVNLSYFLQGFPKQQHYTLPSWFAGEEASEPLFHPPHFTVPGFAAVELAIPLRRR